MLKRGNMGGAFGYFLPAENPQRPTQPAARANAIPNAQYSIVRCSILKSHNSVLVASLRLIRSRGERIVNLLLDMEGE